MPPDPHSWSPSIALRGVPASRGTRATLCRPTKASFSTADARRWTQIDAAPSSASSCLTGSRRRRERFYLRSSACIRVHLRSIFVRKPPTKPVTPDRARAALSCRRRSASTPFTCRNKGIDGDHPPHRRLKNHCPARLSPFHHGLRRQAIHALSGRATPKAWMPTVVGMATGERPAATTTNFAPLVPLPAVVAEATLPSATLPRRWHSAASNQAQS